MYIKFPLLVSWFTLSLAAQTATSGWTFVPESEDQGLLPMRLILVSDTKVIHQSLLAGVRRENTFEAKSDREFVRYTDGRNQTVELRRTDDSLVVQDPKAKQTLVFNRLPDWDQRFESAPPVPRTKLEAIATLKVIMPPEGAEKIAAMKKQDLINLHFGMGMTIRNAFGLWTPNSKLLADLGGGHPDDASMRLIEAYWADLQALSKPDRDDINKSGAAPAAPDRKR